MPRLVQNRFRKPKFNQNGFRNPILLQNGSMSPRLTQNSSKKPRFSVPRFAWLALRSEPMKLQGEALAPEFNCAGCTGPCQPLALRHSQQSAQPTAARMPPRAEAEKPWRSSVCPARGPPHDRCGPKPACVFLPSFPRSPSPGWRRLRACTAELHPLEYVLLDARGRRPKLAGGPPREGS